MLMTLVRLSDKSRAAFFVGQGVGEISRAPGPMCRAAVAQRLRVSCAKLVCNDPNRAHFLGDRSDAAFSGGLAFNQTGLKMLRLR